MIHRAWLAGLGGIAIAGAAAMMLVDRGGIQLVPRAPADRPTLALLTSLPLVFGEHFSLEGGGSPALTRIEQRYNVRPIGVVDRASLAGQQMVMMAHPRAQPAEVLVELDQWVREGGRVLLLADPELSWPSERPLGDLLRPPPAFADTGLLQHWGLTLAGPQASGEVRLEVSGIAVRTVTPGTLSGKSCEILGRGLVARCRIGRGQATVIADADLLNVEPSAADGEPTGANLDLVLTELARFERP